MPKIYKVKDIKENHFIKKDKIFNLPFRVLIVGKSMLSGKSNIVVNLLLRDDFYLNDFEPENIFIISPSLKTDEKLKKVVAVKDIPSSNLFDEYDEDVLDALYELIKEDYNNAIDNSEEPTHKLIIFDDMSFGGKLKDKRNGFMAKLFCNGRHLLINTIVTSQKYSDILTTCRENATGLILFTCSNKQLELIEADHNIMKNKKEFHDMFRTATEQPHSFLVINYSNDKKEMYQDSNFDPIEIKINN
jgi:hypothetical protein